MENWNARNAWFCTVAICLTQFGLVIVFLILASDPAFHHFVRSSAGSLLLNVTGAFAALTVTLWFARCGGGLKFVDRFSIRWPKFKTSFIALLSGALLATVPVLLINLHVGASPENHLVRSIVGLPHADSIFLVVATIGAMVEEFILRGYLFGSFRNSYSLFWSTFCIVIIAAVLHLGALSSSFLGVIVIMALQVLLCVWREKSGNLVYCFLAHAAYNAVCGLI